MYADETRDAGALLSTALDEFAVIAQDVHRALAGRLFGLVGDSVAPVRRMHDAIATVAYASTRFGVRTAPVLVGMTAATFTAATAESAHDDPRGRFALNALNGFWGDRLAVDRPALATQLRLRTHDGQLRKHAHNLVHDLVHDVSAADPITGTTNATGRIVVFLHGLCENDYSWWLGAERHWGDRDVTYGSLLRDQSGWTPLYASFNSGLHISVNGRELSQLLEQLVDQWPVPVTEIALVGHSLGGLVARSAAHDGVDAGLAWAGSLRHVVGLGVPHLGAPLERFVSRGTHALGKLPETRPFATWLNRRSVGIKDLRHGAVLEQDWIDFDPDCVLDDRCTPGTFLPGVDYYTAAATLSLRPQGIFAHDLFVQHRSAFGEHEARRLPFETQNSFHMGRKHHFDLLGDPLVHEQLARWLS